MFSKNILKENDYDKFTTLYNMYLFIVVILVLITYITCLLVKTVSLLEIYVYEACKLPNQAG